MKTILNVRSFNPKSLFLTISEVNWSSRNVITNHNFILRSVANFVRSRNTFMGDSSSSFPVCCTWYTPPVTFTAHVHTPICGYLTHWPMKMWDRGTRLDKQLMDNSPREILLEAPWCTCMFTFCIARFVVLSRIEVVHLFSLIVEESVAHMVLVDRLFKIRK